MDKTCSTCRFWSEPQKQCRINPPTPFVVMEPLSSMDPTVVLKIRSAFPGVAPTDWCGKHQSTYASAGD